MAFDEERRRRERSGSYIAREIADQLRAGELSRVRVVLAAVLGYEPAIEASGVRADPGLEEGFDLPSGANFYNAAPIKDWLGRLDQISNRETRTPVAVLVAGLSAVKRFVLHERPGLDYGLFQDEIHEAQDVVNGMKAIVDRSLDKEKRDERRLIISIGDIINGLLERTVRLNDTRILEGSGMESLFDAVSDVHTFWLCFRTKIRQDRVNIVRSLIESSIYIHTLHDVPREGEVREVFESIRATMILTLLPKWFARRWAAPVR